MKKVFLVACLIAVCSLPVVGGDEKPGTPNNGTGVEGGVTTNNFSTAHNIPLYIGASAFNPRYSTTSYANNLNGAFYRTAGTDTTFWAPLHLPQGAYITSYRVFYTDTDAVNDVSVTLWRYPGAASPAAENLSTFASTGTPGSTSGFSNVGITYDQGATSNAEDNAHYAFVVYLTGTTSSTAVKGIRVWWKRQLSPAPATATFLDVPVGHGLHRFVEALARAGITGGCGSNNYCPDSGLTRGQMAVFLSTALGLHWAVE